MTRETHYRRRGGSSEEEEEVRSPASTKVRVCGHILVRVVGSDSIGFSLGHVTML